MQQIHRVYLFVMRWGCGAHISVVWQVIWKKEGHGFTCNNDITITVSCVLIRDGGAELSHSAMTKKRLESQ